VLLVWYYCVRIVLYCRISMCLLCDWCAIIVWLLCEYCVLSI